jgi:RimJ/RimL family protein N-acetyltransferase
VITCGLEQQRNADVPVPITAERLRLRPWRDEDQAPFAVLNADPRVMKYFPKLLDRDESDGLAARISGRLSERGFGLWAVEVPGVVDFIGFVGLSDAGFPARFTPCIEIGWRLAFEHWGKGYATEAAVAALTHAFGLLGLMEVVSFTVPGNSRSRRVMERLGMKRNPDDDFHHPNVPERHPLRPQVLYRLLRADWINSAPAQSIKRLPWMAP